MNEQQIPVVPVDMKIFSIDEVSEILKKQDPTKLPLWQFHGGPISTPNGIRQVMLKVDRLKPPDIIVPSGPTLVTR